MTASRDGLSAHDALESPTNLPDPSIGDLDTSVPVVTAPASPDLGHLREYADRRKIERDVMPDVENLIDDLLEALAAEHARAEALAAEVERRKAETARAIREREAVSASHTEWEQRARTAEALARGMERGREALLAERDALATEVERLTAHPTGRHACCSIVGTRSREAESARASLAALVAELRAWAEDEHFGDCALYRPYRTVDGPPPCNCHMAAFRAVLDRHAPDAATTTTEPEEG